MKLSRKKVTSFGVLVLAVILSLSLVAIPTDTLISFVGTDNSYLFMYFIAFIGSISTFASIPYPLFVLSLAAGGLNPLLVGLASAFGVITSDTVTFFAAQKGRALLSEKTKHSIESIARYIKRHPQLLTPGLVAYGVISPLSNDFAVISLSLMKYAYYRVVVPLAIGNVIYNVGLAYIGASAYDWIVNLF